MVCASAEDDGSVRPKSFRRRLSSTRGFKNYTKVSDIYWIRIYDGPTPFAIDDHSRILQVDLNTTVAEVCSRLNIKDSTVWVQFGNGDICRLASTESVLSIGEICLEKCGWDSMDRRNRLSIDPDLKYIVRFSAGPNSGSGGSKCSGTVLLLKGLVFPQWKPKVATVLGSVLYLFSVSSEQDPDVYELRGARLEICEPRSQKLVLQLRCLGANADQGVSKDQNIFLGFHDYCERNLWFSWMKEASECKRPSDLLDLSCAGLDAINGFFQSNSWYRNSVTALNLCKNRLRSIPDPVLSLKDLVVLDLCDNMLKDVPEDIAKLVCLEELSVSNNELECLENCLRLPNLKKLNVSNNAIVDTAMTENDMANSLNDDSHPPLTSVDLRNNRLKGSIILGNYEHLSVLDVSDNAVEVLVVSALRGLRELHASHNALRHLAIHGASLRILNVPNNQLENIVTSVPPSHLTRLVITHNKFTALPDWICSCSDLTTLHGDFNDIALVPDDLFNHATRLNSLRLSHNRITSLPSLDRPCHLEELYIHDNSLHSLPENFFNHCGNVKILNLSCNRLNRLPSAKKTQHHSLERLYLTSNCLDDTIFDVIKEFQRLQVLHLSYNSLTYLPENCPRVWPSLEELEVSKNNIQQLPDIISRFKCLRILRAHSNRLRTVPVFASSCSLKLLDLSHNELEEIKLDTLAPKQLKFLDISCNKKNQVDPMHFQAYRCQRPMSLVDVTGQNRSPTLSKKSGIDIHSCSTPWSVGFAESPGSSLRLNVTQIRMPTFCSKEGLFAIVDGEDDDEIPKFLQNTLPSLLVEEKSIKETADNYMKYLVLSAHRELKEKGQRKGACLGICHLSPIKVHTENNYKPTPKKYSIKLANVGDTKSVFCKRSGFLCIGKNNNNRVGYTTRYPDVIPDPDIGQSVVVDEDEFVILGNKGLWSEISPELATKEVKNEQNPILAAKRLQDLAHGFGVEDCLSVMIVKFDGIKNDVDLLMNELRHTIKKNKFKSECCCLRDGTCIHMTHSNKSGSDRSSPSGQSDRNPWENVSSAMNPNVHYSSVRSSGVASRQSDRRSYRGAVARAIQVKVDDEKDRCADETGLSDEQYKCWEYMLEQNTHLLFDKELDTISKGYTRSRMNGLKNIKGLSGSSPQLHLAGNPNPIMKFGTPFLSKHFGSARNFGTGLKNDLRIGPARIPNTGPNAAYFGSLQRLMPYHLEYNFDVIQEKHLSEESVDLEGRMQQYWGVTTTEL